MLPWCQWTPRCSLLLGRWMSISTERAQHPAQTGLVPMCSFLQNTVFYLSLLSTDEEEMKLSMSYLCVIFGPKSPWSAASPLELDWQCAVHCVYCMRPAWGTSCSLVTKSPIQTLTWAPYDYRCSADSTSSVRSQNKTPHTSKITIK